MAVASCPGCGGPIEFSIGSSIVVICDHCRSVVARTDRALEDLGKVAALVDTGSPFRRDLPGKFQGTGFRLTGRTQMEHSSGGIWDEWYAAFDDGRWGWIAEAQGRFYITFATTAASLPSFSQIDIGGTIGDLVVTETGNARVVGGEGEIPWRVVPGCTYDYADLEGPSGKFATIDYSDDEPSLFTGLQTTLEGLGLPVEPPLPSRVSVEKLSCANCGGPLALVAPDRSERIICPNCGGIHDVLSGSLQFLEALKLHGPKPAIDLGAKGTIDGVEYVVAGFMRRSVTFDRKYEWGEYLLFNREQGFRWLVESDNHWSFVWPISTGEVLDRMRGGKKSAKTVTYQGQSYRIFQDAVANVESVIGEFYWKVRVGETVRAVDYIRPPMAISKEISSVITSDSGGKKKKVAEVNYSQSRYLAVTEVEKAFGLAGLLRPATVGMQQPYAGGAILPLWLTFVGALILISILLASRGPHGDVFAETYDFKAPTEASPAAAPASADWSGSGTATSAPSPRPETSRVLFTKPFQLSGGRNLLIEGSAGLNNNWIYVSGDLVNEQTGLTEAFELPMEYYQGVDGGESWSEGSQSVSRVLSSLPAGSYVMRLEGQWAAENETPPLVHIRAREGVFRWSHFFLAFLAITLVAALAGYRALAFENARWEEAGFTAAGAERE